MLRRHYWYVSDLPHTAPQCFKTKIGLYNIISYALRAAASTTYLWQIFHVVFPQFFCVVGNSL